MKIGTIEKTSIFPGSKTEIFDRLQKLKTLQHIAYPYATFEPLDGNHDLRWQTGQTFSFRFRLLGLISFGVHEISVVRFSQDGIYTNEGNPHVPVWNHEILLEEVDETHTRYTDRVEIGAGWKTPFVVLWAKLFYAHRQRKWYKLLQQ